MVVSGSTWNCFAFILSLHDIRLDFALTMLARYPNEADTPVRERFLPEEMRPSLL